MKKIFLVLCLVIFVLGCSSNSRKEVAVQGNQNNENKYKFTYSTPEEEGMNSDYLIEMLDKINKKNSSIDSIIISKNNKIVLESYIAPYKKDDLHNINSCTKSITSILIGIAIDKGIIKSIDEKTSKYFPDIFKGDKANITIKNLLTMSGGFKYSELDLGFEEFTYQNGNLLEYMGKQNLYAKPGTVFKYNSGETHILSAILTKASGMSTKKFAEKYLFNDLDISNYSWSKQMDGYYFGGHSICLTSRDMLKIGMLYINNGKFNNKQIVSEDWINLSILTHITATNSFMKELKSYAYLWWKYSEDIYVAMGYMGQYIINIPKDKTVIVFTSKDQNKPIQLFEKFILKSIKNIEKKNDLGNIEKLNAKIKELEYPSRKELKEIPKKWMSISGKKFKFKEDEEYGFKEVQFDFYNKKEMLMVVKFYEDSTKYKFKVGLEDNYIRTELKDLDKTYLPKKILAQKAYWKNDRLYLKIVPVGEVIEIRYTIKLKDEKLLIRENGKLKSLKSM